MDGEDPVHKCQGRRIQHRWWGLETESAHGEEDTEKLHSLALLLIVIMSNSEMPEATLGVQMGLADVTQDLRSSGAAAGGQPENSRAS